MGAEAAAEVMRMPEMEVRAANLGAAVALAMETTARRLAGKAETGGF